MPQLVKSNHRSRLLGYLLIVCGCACGGWAGAQVPGEVVRAENVRLRQLSLEEGLPTREVKAGTLDTNGLMWLTTAAGLVRYDGIEFTPFGNTNGQYRGSIHRGPSGLLYLSEERRTDAVVLINPYTFAKRSFPLTRPDSAATFNGWYQRDGSPLYWLAGDQIYYLAQPSDGGTDPASPSTTGWAPYPISLHRRPRPTTPTEQLIYADRTTYSIWDPARRTLTHKSADRQEHNSLLPANTTSVWRDRRGRHWILTATGTHLLPAGGREIAPASQPLLASVGLNFSHEDDFGNLLLGYLDPYLLRVERLLLITPEGIVDLAEVLKHENRLVAAQGHDFRQRINLLTFGGLQQVTLAPNNTDIFTHHLYQAGLSTTQFGHVMRGFTTGPDSALYANKDTRTNAWYRMSTDRYPEVDTLIIRDENGREVDQFGCGTNLVAVEDYVFGHSCWRDPDSIRGHLYRYHPRLDTWRQYHLPKEGHVIRYLIAQPDQQRLWLFNQAFNGGPGSIMQFDYQRESFVELNPVRGSATLMGYPRSVVADFTTGIIWIGSTSALYQYDLATNRLTEYKLPNNRPTRVLSLLFSDKGSPSRELLVGTLGEGLYAFNLATKTFTRRGGVVQAGATRRSKDFILLPSNDVAAMAYTPLGDLLLTTFNGLVLSTPDGQTLFKEEDGLPNNEFNTPSLHFDSLSGRFYAGGINGFVSFAPANLRPTLSPYKPILLRYHELDERLGRETSKNLPPRLPKHLVVQPTVAYFNLDFGLPDFTDPAACRYETMLEGYDPLWRAPVSTPSVRYTRLPPGQYNFRLRAIDAQGRRSAEVNPVAILVLKPWYRRTWFYALVGLSTLSLMGVLVYRRFERLRERYEAQRALQEAQLRALRQQMNPHFISNAMNAIREYIYKEKPAVAAGYLTDFSRLMRLFLEASRTSMTTIEDETKLLGHYVRLEQLRFPGKFSYTIEVDDELDPEMDEVPSFILQPIVENAINHGLLPYSGGGRLHISFVLEKATDAIVCTVTDNGSGIANSTKETHTEHVSRATQILKDRQASLAQDGHVQFSVTTEEAYPGTDRPGTRVVVRVAPTFVD